MSKTQFWTLNIVGGVCALLILCNVALGQLNIRLNQTVTLTQNQFTQAQNLHNTAQNLLTRVAQGAQTDAGLRQLLVRHDFKVTLNTPNTNGPAAPTP